jgi:hypothetical protein
MHANFIVYSSVWPLRIGYDAFLKKIDDHAQHASIANPRTPQSYVLAYQLKEYIRYRSCGVWRLKAPSTNMPGLLNLESLP